MCIRVTVKTTVIKTTTAIMEANNIHLKVDHESLRYFIFIHHTNISLMFFLWYHFIY